MLLVFPFQLLTKSTDYIKHQLLYGRHYPLTICTYQFIAGELPLLWSFQRFKCNTQEKFFFDSNTVDDFDYLNDLVTTSYVVETVKPSNGSTLLEANSQFFKPAILQYKTQTVSPKLI